MRGRAGEGAPGRRLGGPQGAAGAEPAPRPSEEEPFRLGWVSIPSDDLPTADILTFLNGLFPG